MLALWWNDFCNNLTYVCSRFCEPDLQHIIPQKGKKKLGSYQEDDLTDEGF